MTTRGETIRVSVLFFARAKDLAGTRQTSLSLPTPATVADAARALRERYPALVEYLDSCRLAVDREFANPEKPLRDDCEFAVIPPVSGG